MKKKRSLNVGLYSDIYRLVTFTLDMMIENTNDTIYHMIVETTNSMIMETFIQGHIYTRNQNSRANFSRKFLNIDLDEIQYVVSTCYLLVC